MDMRSRRSLNRALLELGERKGFRTEEFDDFVNYEFANVANPKGAFCRVIRLVGPGRVVVVFHYKMNPHGGMRSRQDYSLSYVDAAGRLVQFDPKAIMAGRTASWDQVVGSWLAEHGAKEFRGRWWARDLALEIMRQVDAWAAVNTWLQPTPEVP